MVADMEEPSHSVLCLQRLPDRQLDSGCWRHCVSCSWVAESAVVVPPQHVSTRYMNLSVLYLWRLFILIIITLFILINILIVYKLIVCGGGCEVQGTPFVAG